MYGSDGPCFPSLRVKLTLYPVRHRHRLVRHLWWWRDTIPWDKTPSAVEQQRCPAAEGYGVFPGWFAFRAGGEAGICGTGSPVAVMGLAPRAFTCSARAALSCPNFSIRRWSSPRCLFRTSSYDGFPILLLHLRVTPASRWWHADAPVIKGRIHHRSYPAQAPVQPRFHRYRTVHIRRYSAPPIAEAVPTTTIPSHRYCLRFTMVLILAISCPPVTDDIHPCAHLPVTGWQAG